MDDGVTAPGPGGETVPAGARRAPIMEARLFLGGGGSARVFTGKRYPDRRYDSLAPGEDTG